MDAKTIYGPFVPQFKYNRDGQWIEDATGNRLLDLRGWGFLTGQGSAALNMSEDEAAQIQDRIGEHVTGLMNRNADTVRQAVDNEILATSNDIDAYLQSDVPLECYQQDIDVKLNQMRAKVRELLS